MKRILLKGLCVLALVGCGAVKGKDGKDGKSAEATSGEPGVAGAAGENGDDAVVGSLHCDYKLIYPNDPTVYVMHYAELVFSEGSTLATLTMTNSSTGQQLFREAALFSSEEIVEINGVNWLATKDALIHKASKIKYIPKCK